MTREEAIETLKANYPDKCFELLRNAVDIAIESLEADVPDTNVGDTISRQAAIDAIWEHLTKILENTDYDLFFQDVHKMSHRHLAELIQILPPAQPERKKGKWDTFFSDSHKVHKIGVECSCCGYRTQERTIYCPNCGAEMEKGETDE